MRMSFGKLAIALVVAGAVLFALAPIGQNDGSYWEDGPGWLGAIGWFGFMLCCLMLIVTGVAALVSRLRHHDSSVPH